MLSGEGNENGEKTTIGLFSKKTTSARISDFLITAKIFMLFFQQIAP